MDPVADSGLTIILLGNTGAGKSASGNTILGCQAFESRPSFKSVMTKISEATENVFGIQVSVIDTPGILGSEELIKNYCQSVLQSSRPSLFLVVYSVGRFTDEQAKALNAAITVLRDVNALGKSLLLFTNGDSLKKMSLDDFIFEDKEGPLPDIVLNDFNGKIHLFNNESGGREQVKELLEKFKNLQAYDQELPAAYSGDASKLKELRIVLLGLPGAGKSSTGNTILGSDHFESDSDFDGVRTETVCKSEEVEDCRITVVDTPGLTDEFLSPEALYDEIMKSVVQVCEGPHAFILVVKIGRMSKNDPLLLEALCALFGSDAMKYTMVVFTHGDELEGQSIKQKIQSSSFVSELVSKCGGRYCVFDNRGRKSKRQVQNLINKINDMVTANGGKLYDSNMFRTARTFCTEAAGNQRGQAGINETSRKTAQKRLQRYISKFWDAVRQLFTSCFRPSATESDEENLPLVEHESQQGIVL